jgi:hypothetical protein
VHEKRCAKCKVTKPVAEFYKNTARTDGVSVYCAKCLVVDIDARKLRRRTELLTLLGGRCRRCGYDADPHALHVDHVNGGGAAERRAGLSVTSASLLRGVAAHPEKFQLLCANCNLIKKIERREFGSRTYRQPPLTERVLRRGTFTTKRCPRCETIKQVAEFSRSAARSDGLSGFCRECMNAIHAESARRHRVELLKVLGGECLSCGFANQLALQVDHVNGNGSAHRRSVGNSHACTLLRLVKENPDDYQLLCANCNVIKRHVNGEHRGERVYRRDVSTVRTLKGRAHADAAKVATANARRAILVAEVERRRPLERSPIRLPQGSWSRHHLRCLGCQRSDRKHAAEGLCFACNAKAKRYTRWCRTEGRVSPPDHL